MNSDYINPFDLGGGVLRCPGCMKTYAQGTSVCPHCGYRYTPLKPGEVFLPVGTVLCGMYIIGRVLGSGGFGITYMAWDIKNARRVAIKEYLPGNLATRSTGSSLVSIHSGEKYDLYVRGIEKFTNEAKRLAGFNDDPSIVTIYASFRANNTAYMVMEYLDGETVDSRLKREGRIPVDEAVEIISVVAKSLARVHRVGVLHRDIAPDNIILTKDYKVKIIDFGSARYCTANNEETLTVMIKRGFSAEEQYRSHGDQGPHTDVYSVGALLYKMITGQTPPDSLERRACVEEGRDSLIPASRLVQGVPQSVDRAIGHAMQLKIRDRTPNMGAFLAELSGKTVVQPKPQTSEKQPKKSHGGLVAALLILIILISVGVTVILLNIQKNGDTQDETETSAQTTAAAYESSRQETAPPYTTETTTALPTQLITVPTETQTESEPETEEPTEDTTEDTDYYEPEDTEYEEPDTVDYTDGEDYYG